MEIQKKKRYQNRKLSNEADLLALATLEISIHLNLSKDLPNDRYYVGIDVPDEVGI